MPARTHNRLMLLGFRLKNGGLGQVIIKIGSRTEPKKQILKGIITNFRETNENTFYEKIEGGFTHRPPMAPSLIGSLFFPVSRDSVLTSFSKSGITQGMLRSIRARVHSTLSMPVITAFSTAKARDLIEKPLSFGVETVKKGRERVTEKYIRSAIDWLEVHKGIPATCDGSFYVSAWWKLPFKELDFGFGKPRHGGPIVSGNDEFVLLLSDENGMGINVWMGLEKEKMETFKSCVFEI